MNRFEQLHALLDQKPRANLGFFPTPLVRLNRLSEQLGVKDGLTPEQRFFLSWARVWAGNARPEYLQYLMTVDVHSPNEARVNGALPMIDAWYKAFGIKKSDKLFVPKAGRAHIW